MRALLRITFAVVALALAPGVGSAFGPGGHVEAAEGSWDQVVALPGNGHLRGDEVARRCYAWGAVFPDVRSVVPFARQLGDLKRRIEGVPGVKTVRLDLTDVGPLGFDTHDLRLGLAVVDAARRSGSRELLAFALGCLAHGCHDRDEQTFTMQRAALAGRAGDVSVTCDAQGHARGFHVGDEVQLVNEAMREAAQPDGRMRFVRDATRRLVQGGFQAEVRSIALAARLSAFYHDAARAHALGQNPAATPISARGFANASRLLEAAMVLVPAAMRRDRLGEAARAFKSRYVDLAWWADVVYGITEVLARVLTLGQRGILDLGDLALNLCKGRVLAKQPVVDVLEGAISGGGSWRRVEQRYAGNAQLQRLRRSGLLERATHGYPEIARAIALDVSGRGTASRFVDWPLIDERALRGVAAASYLVDPVPPAPARPDDPRRLAQWQRDLADWQARHERGLLARAGGFVVTDVRWVDAVTGQALARLGANDQGRRVRVEVALRGLHPRAGWLFAGRPLALEVVVQEDAVAGADPALARAAHVVPVDAVDPLRMGDTPPPVLTLEVAAPLTAGTRGYHVELRYEGLVVFTSDWDAVAARGASGPHHAASYGTYHPDALRSLPIDGR